MKVRVAPGADVVPGHALGDRDHGQVRQRAAWTSRAVAGDEQVAERGHDRPGPVSSRFHPAQVLGDHRVPLARVGALEHPPHLGQRHVEGAQPADQQGGGHLVDRVAPVPALRRRPRTGAAGPARGSAAGS